MTSTDKLPPLTMPKGMAVDLKTAAPVVDKPTITLERETPKELPPIPVGFAPLQPGVPSKPVAFYQPCRWELTPISETLVDCVNSTTGDVFRGTRKEFSAHIKV